MDESMPWVRPKPGEADISDLSTQTDPVVDAWEALLVAAARYASPVDPGRAENGF